jgi:ABC-type taurine transport system ATPase subunit
VSLLSIEHVRLADQLPDRMLLNDLNLELDGGELVAIWGKRQSGRSTLLRVAAGLIRPDAGIVRFEGRELTEPVAIGAGISLCTGGLRGGEAWPVEQDIVDVQLARGVPRKLARARARDALERTGAGDCATRLPRDLRGADRVRVALAMALTSAPKLLLVDDVMAGVEMIGCDPILRLLRSLADEGLAVLTCTDETLALAGTDRALTLWEGRLHGRRAPELAEVVPLRRAASS